MITVGARISVLNDDIDGEILAILNDQVTVLTDEGFEMDFEINEIVVIDGSLSKRDFSPQKISEVLKEKEERTYKKSIKLKPKDRVQPAMVVDLHIHQIVPTERGLSNHDMLTIQIDEAQRQLEFAIRKNIQRIVFIHGVGEGVLRAELEYLFRRYDNVKYEDANLQKYGRGATAVYIFQNTPKN